MSPESNSSISGFTPAARMTRAMRRTFSGVLMTTWPPEFIVLRSSVQMSGRSAAICSTRASGTHERGAGPGDRRIVLRGHEASAGAGREVEDQILVAGADALDDLAIEVKLHRRAPGRGIAHMDMRDGGARLRRLQAGVGDLRGRDRQMRRLLRASSDCR